MTATISVLVPVRGEAPFLAQALDSLRAQTHHEWQALLLPIACDEAPLHMQAATDARMHVLGGTHACAAGALRIAGEQLQGDFLCVLDGDDLLEPDAFAALLAAFREHPGTGMAYSRHVLVDAGNRILGAGPLCELPYSPEALLLDFMTGPLQLVHQDAYTQAGGFSASHPDAADYDLCLRLSEHVGITHVPRALYRRRVHAHSPAVTRWAEQIEARYNAFADAVKRRGLDAHYDCALEIDSWHVLDPLRPFGGVRGLA